MILGVIADDFTGATDIAGFLVNNGLPSVQLTDLSDTPLPPGIQAVVISLKSRSCPLEEAVSLSLSALRKLQKEGCSQFFFKYCSTFDSTAQGNIGPVTDALLEALGERFTVICPALPINGRTVYKGYLFVNDVPLNESGMRNHPITPMRDANLMRLMDAQAYGKSGNVPFSIVSKGPSAVQNHLASLKQQGISYAVLDALTDENLDVLASSLGNMPLVTGGSGLGGALARLHAGKSAASADATRLGLPTGGKTVLLSGSCSEMTNKQVAAYQKQGPFYQVNIDRCMENAEKYAEEMATALCAAAASPMPPLVSATASPERLCEIQERFGKEHSHQQVEHFFGRLAALLHNAEYDHFIVAGGETSSIVTQALGVKGFYIGPQIVPGVPWVRAINAQLSLALKSGNFGDEHFFATAVNLIP